MSTFYFVKLCLYWGIGNVKFRESHVNNYAEQVDYSMPDLRREIKSFNQDCFCQG